MSAQTRVSLGRDGSGRPITVNERGLAAFREAERLLGHKLTIVQGGYRAGNGATASAGTHDGGTVLDIRVWDLPGGTSPADVVLELRRVGFAAWFRTQAQGFDPHIHAVLIGDTDLVRSAVNQVVAYHNGRNGLRGNARDDGPDGYRLMTWEKYLALKAANVPPVPPTTNTTIAMSAIQMAARGEAISHSYLADAVQFVAWGTHRNVQAIPALTALAWRTTYKFRSARLFSYAVKCVQAKFGLAQDGIFGPVTAAVMKRYGYTVITPEGKVL